MNAESRNGRTRGLVPARSDEGVTAVIVAIVMVVLIGFAALVVDLGALYRERRSLQTAADAAALAGVQELPSSTAAATSKARSYVALNAPEATDVAVTFPAGDTVKVVIDAPKVGLFFARVWGDSTARIGAKAAARITSPTAFSKGIVPIGVFPLGGSESVASAYGYTWGQDVTIKRGGGSGTTGNYGWVDLGQGNGAKALSELLASGGGSAALYQMIGAVPGNKVPSKDGLDAWIDTDVHSFSEVCPPPDANGVVHVNLLPSDPPGGCHRLVLVPIVINPEPGKRYTWPNGSSSQIQVIGFAQFFITDTGGNGKNAWIRGTFVRTVSAEEAAAGTVGSTGQVHYGLVQ
jgi:hypothetical protein